MTTIGQPYEKFFRRLDSVFKVGDKVEFLCDVNFGDINTKAKNPDAKLALTGECAEVCGVRGTRLALTVGGEPFDWPIRLVKRISDATLERAGASPTGEDSHSASYRGLEEAPLSPKKIEVGDASGNSNSKRVGERFAVCPNITNECEIIALVGNKYRVRWSLKGDEMEVDAAFLTTLKPIQIFEEPDEKLFINGSCKPILPQDAPVAVVLFAGGGGVEAGMVEAGIRPVIAVEFDPKKPQLSGAIADTHEKNFSEYGCKVVRKSVQEVAASRFAGFPRNPFNLHSSNMCSNFSNAKGGGAIETAEDIEMATATASGIYQLQPETFTLENVKRYSSSQSFKIIVQALEEEGYAWHGEVITLLDCQARERFVVVAASGWLPPLPDPIEPVGWYEVVADLIPEMADTELVPGQNKALEEFLSNNEPTPLLIQRTGVRREMPDIRPATKPCFTIRRIFFTDGKGANRNKFADIWLPGGTVKSLSIAAAARLQGFPDWYEFPPDTATAGSIIGYSVPPKFATRLFKSLTEIPKRHEFAYRQLRQKGVSHKQAIALLIPS